MTEVTDILIWDSPSVCLVPIAVLVACLDTLSECRACSDVGTDINTVGCWNDTERGKPVLLAEYPVPMSLCYHKSNMDCHIKLYTIKRLGFVKYASKFTPLEFKPFSDSLS